MRLVVARAADKALARVPQKVAANVLVRMKAIAGDPFAPHMNVKPLTGSPATYRLRVGDWRALYAVDRAAQTVVLLDVVKREEAYR